MLAGPDTESYGAKVDELAHQLGVASAMRRLGLSFGEDKYQLLTQAESLLVVAGKKLGNVVIEALSVGTPVVASRKTPWKELEDRDCGRWVDLDAESLATAVNDLLGAPDRRRGMGARGRALVSRKYGWTSIAHAMRLVYESCIGGQRPPPHAFLEKGG